VEFAAKIAEIFCYINNANICLEICVLRFIQLKRASANFE